ncbi:MAG: ATP-binding protein, partial [Oscillospiraceae bacterium]|nr:ATP-binding protein [Oscillospiraceae bacterium]
MRKYFNTEGCCYPDEHYMVNPDSRLKKIKEMVDAGKYFTINRGRQYGKTT